MALSKSHVRDVLGMYCAKGGSVLSDFRSLQECCAQMNRATRPSLHSLEVLKLDEKSLLVSFGPCLCQENKYSINTGNV